MVEDMATKAALGDEESQLLVTEEEMKELHRQVSQLSFLFTNCNLGCRKQCKSVLQVHNWRSDLTIGRIKE